MNRLRRLISEIHRRSLWQVLAMCLAGAWVALQVAGQAAPPGVDRPRTPRTPQEGMDRQP